MSTLANKEETTRRFSQISKKVRDLVELVSKTNEGDQDSMLMKKNYGPMNCMGCEKNLTNISGMPVDHHAWKKMPFREGSMTESQDMLMVSQKCFQHCSQKHQIKLKAIKIS